MNKNKYFISIIFILFGMCVFLYPKFSNYLAEKNQSEVIRVYKVKSDNMEDTQISLEYENAKKYNNELILGEENITNSYESLLNFSDDGIMAYIEIPKISVYLPIYHGTEDTILKKGVGHIKYTSLPIGGISTHCVLVGHTGLSKAKLFNRLNELCKDDYFYINVINETLVYQVYKIEVILPDEIDSLQIIEGQDLITLVTCTPYGVNTHRLLIHGVRVEDNDIENQLIESQSNKSYIFYIIAVIIIFFYCILLNYIVKYKKKNIH